MDGIVYLSPSGAHPVNFPNLFDDLCLLLPDADARGPAAGLPGAAPQAPRRADAALLDEFPSGRVIVLLDNLEDVIDSSSADLRAHRSGAG